LHPAARRAAPYHRRQQRLSHVLAPGDRRDQGRVAPRFLLQHRAPGESPSPRLDDRGGAGDVDRTPKRRKPLPGPQVAAGLSALVRLRLRHHLLAPPAAHGHAQGAAEMTLTIMDSSMPSCPGIARRKTRVNALMTRASIERKHFNRRGWIAGSSPAMTVDGSAPMAGMT